MLFYLLTFDTLLLIRFLVEFGAAIAVLFSAIQPYIHVGHVWAQAFMGVWGHPSPLPRKSLNKVTQE